MTKLSVARIFEVSQIATTKAYSELQPFIDYVNSLADNLVRVLVNGISIRDNLDATIITLEMKDQTPQSVATKKVPLAVYVARCNPSLPFLIGHAWSIGASGELILTTKFDSVPTASVAVTFIVHYS